MRNKIETCDETEIELYILNTKYHIGRKLGPAYHNNHPYGEAWWWQLHDARMF